MKKRWLALFITCSLVSNVSAMTMTDALRDGAEYNLSNKITQEQIRSAQYKIEETYASYWPQVNLIGKTRSTDRGYGEYYQRDDDESAMINIAVQYTILDLSRGPQVDAAKKAYEAAKWNERIQEEKLKFDIIKAYLNVLSKKRTVEVTEGYLHDVVILANKLRSRVSGGLSPESDSIRAQASLDEAETQKENALKSLEDAKVFLASLIGTDQEISDSFNENSIKNLSYVVDDLRLNQENLLLKMLSTQIEQKRNEADSVKKNDYPKVQILGNYKDHFSQNVQSPDTQYFIQVSMPIFDGFLNRNKEYDSLSQLKLSEYNYESALRDLHRNFSALKLSLIKEENIWRLNKKTVEKSLKTLSLYNSEFTLGVRPLSDIITAHKDLFNAQKALVESKYNYCTYIAAIYNLYGETDHSLTKI